MTTSPTGNPPEKNKQGKTLLIIGIGALVLVCLCVAAAAAAVFSFRSVVQETAIPEAAPDAYAEITVKDDGCSVARTEVEGYTPVRMLTWVVTNLETDQIVLERNAEDEFEYRYFSPGKYTIHLKAWYAGQYYPVSNEVQVECK